MSDTPETDAIDRSNYISADGWNNLCEHALRLERQRDELADALREIVAVEDGPSGFISLYAYNAAIDNARDVLARIEGGKQ